MFRALWSASLASNLGSWAQNVGGAWLMTTLTTDALPVALMQTAATLPSFLVGLPAGSLADRVDRRGLLLVTHALMLASVVVLAGLTLLNVVTPWMLLGLTFALGLGSAVNAPTWGSLLPDVVSRQQMPTAVSTNSLGYNIARATGPSVGGALVAVSGPAATFVANGISYIAALIVVRRWLPAGLHKDTGAQHEPFGRAILAGLAYAWNTPLQRVVLVRSILWMTCASVLWSLLPLVARNELDLQAPGYGFLVTCVGLGAIGGAFSLPMLRQRFRTNSLLILGIVLFTAMLLVLAWVRWLPLVWLMLALGGAAWTCSNQNFQIAVQLSAAHWVRARAIAMYLLTFQGGQAIGGPIWGSVAEHVGNSLALTLAAVGVLAGVLAALRWPIEDHVS